MSSFGSGRLHHATCLSWLVLGVTMTSHADEPRQSTPLVMSGRTPMVEVRVNGEGPFRFVVDPGNETLIDRGLAERLGLSGDASAQDTVLVERLSVAGDELGPVKAALWEAESMSPGSVAPDGIMALSLFAERLLTIDYAKREFVLESGALPPSNGGDVLDYSLTKEGAVAIPMSVGGLEVQARMDVGVLGGFTFPTDYVEKLSLVAAPGRIGWSFTSEGKKVEIVGARLDGFAQIGKHRIERPGIDFSEAYTDVFVGYDAVNHFAVTFDQTNERVGFHADLEHDEFLLESAARVPALAEGGADLRTAFNREPDHVRMVVMLSPT